MKAFAAKVLLLLVSINIYKHIPTARCPTHVPVAPPCLLSARWRPAHACTHKNAGLDRSTHHDMMAPAFAHACIRTLRAASDSASFVFKSTLLAFTRSISDCVSSFSTLQVHTALNLKHMYTYLRACEHHDNRNETLFFCNVARVFKRMPGI